MLDFNFIITYYSVDEYKEYYNVSTLFNTDDDIIMLNKTIAESYQNDIDIVDKFVLPAKQHAKIDDAVYLHQVAFFFVVSKLLPYFENKIIEENSGINNEVYAEIEKKRIAKQRRDALRKERVRLSTYLKTQLVSIAQDKGIEKASRLSKSQLLTKLAAYYVNNY
jgi:hypothetical protein